MSGADFFLLNEIATSELRNLAEFSTKLTDFTVPGSELGTELSLAELAQLREITGRLVHEATVLHNRVDFLFRTKDAKCLKPSHA